LLLLAAAAVYTYICVFMLKMLNVSVVVIHISEHNVWYTLLDFTASLVYS